MVRMPVPSEDSLKELIRSRDGDHLDAVRAALDAAGVQYVLSSTAPNFDITTIGQGNDVEVILSVRTEDYEAARQTLEADALSEPLPEGHYLLEFSDEELAGVIVSLDEWSAYDVAHARRLIQERNVNPDTIQTQKEVRIRRLRRGERGPRLLIVLAYICTFFGIGWVFFGPPYIMIIGPGLGIGLPASLIWMRKKTEEGTFHTFDATARQHGKILLLINGVFYGLFFVAGFLAVLGGDH